jgi:hypothetical protein
LSPHIDLHRGGPAFAWAYKQVAEQSDADVFVIFGTAHTYVSHPFCLTRKHFETPLGTARVDARFIDSVVREYDELLGDGVGHKLLADEHAHRHEHSIEFQVVFLQHLLGERREFTIVPILTGSFHKYLRNGAAPSQHLAIGGFFEAVRRAAAERGGKVCCISGGDLAHIGRRFGDAELLGQERLAEQDRDDRQLLDAACRVDSGAFFRHVADQSDRSRICGLAPTYALLEVTRPTRGELLVYDQAVEPDGTSCVSFASVAFYDDGADAVQNGSQAIDS